MSLIFGCWQIKIKNTNQLSWAIQTKLSPWLSFLLFSPLFSVFFPPSPPFPLSCFSWFSPPPKFCSLTLKALSPPLATGTGQFSPSFTIIESFYNVLQWLISFYSHRCHLFLTEIQQKSQKKMCVCASVFVSDTLCICVIVYIDVCVCWWKL